MPRNTEREYLHLVHTDFFERDSVIRTYTRSYNGVSSSQGAELIWTDLLRFREESARLCAQKLGEGDVPAVDTADIAAFMYPDLTLRELAKCDRWAFLTRLQLGVRCSYGAGAGGPAGSHFEDGR